MTEEKGIFKNHIGETICSVILGFLEVVALSMYYKDSLHFWLESAGNGLLFLGLWIVCAALVFLFFRLLMLLLRPANVIGETTYAHPFLLSVLVLTLFYLPWIILFYPGSAIYDMTYQIVQGAGFVPVNAHHPIFSTWVVGLLARLSLSLTGKLNLGIFLYILVQSAVCILAFSAMISFMANRGVRKGFWLTILFLLAVVPLFGGAMQCGTKDTIFTGLFVLFCTYAARLLLGEGSSFKAGSWILTFVLALLLCLFRNGIWVIMVPTFVVFLIALRKEKKVRAIFAALSVAVIAISLLFNTFTARAYNTGTETGEMLSIPFQQTARYVRDHEEEVTEEEAAIIETTFGLDNYRQIGELYYPMSSDPVKARYHWWASDEEGSVLKAYLKNWGGMLKKHPLTYVEATAANTFGYYSITPVIKTQRWGAGTTVQFGPDRLAVQNVVDQSDGALSEDLIPESPKALEPAQKVLSSWYFLWQKVPVADLFYKCGFYFFILLAVTIYYGKRKRRLVLLSVPMFLLILMAVASPVNEHIRYILPVCASLPILMSACARSEY